MRAQHADPPSFGRSTHERLHDLLRHRLPASRQSTGDFVLTSRPQRGVQPRRHRHVSQPTALGAGDMPAPLGSLHAHLARLEVHVVGFEQHDLAASTAASPPRSTMSAERDEEGGRVGPLLIRGMVRAGTRGNPRPSPYQTTPSSLRSAAALQNEPPKSRSPRMPSLAARQFHAALARPSLPARQ